MPLTIKLDKPISIHGANGAEEINEVQFRDPGTGDFFDLGLPNRNIIEQDRANPNIQRIEVIWEPRLVRSWMMRLSGRTQSELEQVPPAKLNDFLTWIGAALNPSGN